MQAEITAWRKTRKGAAVGKRAAAITIYLTALEVDTYNLNGQVEFFHSDRYRLLRGIAYLRTRGLTDLAETIAAEVRRQEERQQV